MKKRYNGEDNSYITSEDSNSGMKDAYDVGQAETRINNAKERMRAEAEGARDEGKITESGDQGFGGAGSSRTVKATPKPAAKPAAKPPAKPAAKVEPKPEYKPAIKASEMPADDTQKSVTDRAKATRERARSGSDSTDGRSVNERLRDSGIGSSISNYFSNFKTPAERKAQERKEKAAKGSYAGGGSVGSASRRADGIATKGKTRGKYI